MYLEIISTVSYLRFRLTILPPAVISKKVHFLRVYAFDFDVTVGLRAGGGARARAKKVRFRKKVRNIKKSTNFERESRI